MRDITEIKKLMDQAENQYNNLLRIAKDEEKELGATKKNTIEYFNALIFALNNAYEIIDKGLNGEFLFVNVETYDKVESEVK